MKFFLLWLQESVTENKTNWSQPPQLNPLITASSTAVIGSINIHICLSSLPYTVNSCYYTPIYLCCLLHLEWGNSYAHTIITVYLRLFWSLEIYRNTYSAPAGSHRTASFTWIHLDHRPYSRQVTEWMECDVVIHPPPTVFPKAGNGALRDQWAIKYHCQNYSPTIVFTVRDLVHWNYVTSENILRVCKSWKSLLIYVLPTNIFFVHPTLTPLQLTSDKSQHGCG